VGGGKGTYGRLPLSTWTQLQGTGRHCPVLEAGGEGQAIVVVGVTGTLDGNACVACPTTATATWTSSRALFTLAEDLLPHQGARKHAQESSQSGSLPLVLICAFTTTLIDLQLNGGGARNNIFLVVLSSYV
jgi:hypothetical protein